MGSTSHKRLPLSIDDVFDSTLSLIDEPLLYDDLSLAVKEEAEGSPQARAPQAAVPSFSLVDDWSDDEDHRHGGGVDFTIPLPPPPEQPIVAKIQSKPFKTNKAAGYQFEKPATGNRTLLKLAPSLAASAFQDTSEAKDSSMKSETRGSVEEVHVSERSPRVAAVTLGDSPVDDSINHSAAEVDNKQTAILQQDSSDDFQSTGPADTPCSYINITNAIPEDLDGTHAQLLGATGEQEPTVVSHGAEIGNSFSEAFQLPSGDAECGQELDSCLQVVTQFVDVKETDEAIGVNGSRSETAVVVVTTSHLPLDSPIPCGLSVAPAASHVNSSPEATEDVTESHQITVPDLGEAGFAPVAPALSEAVSEEDCGTKLVADSTFIAPSEAGLTLDSNGVIALPLPQPVADAKTAVSNGSDTPPPVDGPDSLLSATTAIVPVGVDQWQLTELKPVTAAESAALARALPLISGLISSEKDGETSHPSKTEVGALVQMASVLHEEWLKRRMKAKPSTSSSTTSSGYIVVEPEDDDSGPKATCPASTTMQSTAPPPHTDTTAADAEADRLFFEQMLYMLYGELETERAKVRQFQARQQGGDRKVESASAASAAAAEGGSSPQAATSQKTEKGTQPPRSAKTFQNGKFPTTEDEWGMFLDALKTKVADQQKRHESKKQGDVPSSKAADTTGGTTGSSRPTSAWRQQKYHAADAQAVPTPQPTVVPPPPPSPSPAPAPGPAAYSKQPSPVPQEPILPKETAPAQAHSSGKPPQVPGVPLVHPSSPAKHEIPNVHAARSLQVQEPLRDAMVASPMTTAPAPVQQPIAVNPGVVHQPAPQNQVPASAPMHTQAASPASIYGQPAAVYATQPMIHHYMGQAQQKTGVALSQFELYGQNEPKVKKSSSMKLPSLKKVFSGKNIPATRPPMAASALFAQHSRQQLSHEEKLVMQRLQMGSGPGPSIIPGPTPLQAMAAQQQGPPPAVVAGRLERLQTLVNMTADEVKAHQLNQPMPQQQMQTQQPMLVQQPGPQHMAQAHGQGPTMMYQQGQIPTSAPQPAPIQGATFIPSGSQPYVRVPTVQQQAGHLEANRVVITGPNVAQSGPAAPHAFTAATEPPMFSDPSLLVKFTVPGTHPSEVYNTLPPQNSQLGAHPPEWSPLQSNTIYTQVSQHVPQQLQPQPPQPQPPQPQAPVAQPNLQQAGPQAGQQYANQQYTRQQYAGQQHAVQQHTGQQYSGQQYVGQQYSGQQVQQAAQAQQYSGQQVQQAAQAQQYMVQQYGRQQLQQAGAASMQQQLPTADVSVMARPPKADAARAGTWSSQEKMLLARLQTPASTMNGQPLIAKPDGLKKQFSKKFKKTILEML